MDTDRNLLFGVLALQADLIDTDQFVDACSLWAARKNVPLPNLLVERGWILPADKDHLEYLLERKLTKHGGDAKASLAAVADDVKRSLAALGDAEIERSLADLPRPNDPMALTMDHVAGQRERYTLTRLHATGGIGRVWLAHDGDLGRSVALKELRPERADNAAHWNRFLREARITGQLEHPGIVPVYELARRPDNGQPFYTMRFVKGRTLSEATRDYHHKRAAGQGDSLEFLNLLNAFVTVCNTVGYAHSRGVLHRDLKGHNVILGDFGDVVLLDWGLAKLLGRPDDDADTPPIQLDQDASGEVDLTVHGQAIGTPAYMAPEQAAGRLDQIDIRTDIYGLGAMLYEILTGQPPFSGADTDSVLRKVQNEEPPPPSQLWPDVPPVLEALCLRALAKRPTDRPGAAGELVQGVQGWQEFERRKAEEALRESEALYHSLVESLPCVVVRKDLEGRFTFANQRFCELVGLPLERLLGKTNFDIDINRRDLAEKYRRDDQKVIETGAVLEDIEELPGQSQRYVHILKTAVRDASGKIIGIQGVSWDVTERKLAEEELRKSRERFELAVLGSQDGLWDWDLETGSFYLSAWYTNMLGWDEHEFPKTVAEWERWLHPDDREQALAVRQAHLEGRTSQYESEHRLLHKDGSYRWVRSRGVAVRDAAGKPRRVAGSIEDITARRRAEQELAHERYLFQSLMDTTLDRIYFKDRNSRFIRVNKSASERIWPSDPADVLGKTDFDFFTEKHARQAYEDEQEIMRTGQPIVAKEEEETWPDGHVTWVSTTKMPLRDSHGAIIGTFGISRDITELKRADAALELKRRLNWGARKSK